MGNTKEKILETALRLFARDGYAAVSTTQIAGELGMTKGALYRHYESKRDIFNSIIAHMEAQDAARASDFSLPTGTFAEMPAAYRTAALEDVRRFSRAMFVYWTEEPFSAAFRRMLTLEQYRDAEMAALCRQYLSLGPLGYMEDLFSCLVSAQDAAVLALDFYAPLFLLYSAYDAASDKGAVTARAEAHIDRFLARLSAAQQS